MHSTPFFSSFCCVCSCLWPVFLHYYRDITVGMESYAVVLVTRLCESLWNCIIGAYLHMIPVLRHVTPYVMYIYTCECITGTGAFIQCSDSVRVFSVPVEVLSSELWVSYGMFSLVHRYLLLNRRVLVSRLPQSECCCCRSDWWLWPLQRQEEKALHCILWRRQGSDWEACCSEQQRERVSSTVLAKKHKLKLHNAYGAQIANIVKLSFPTCIWCCRGS